MTDILLTNDDGYQSIGFYPLYKELKKEFSVFAIPPLDQKSWIGKSISTRKNLELFDVKIGEYNIKSLNGTPADCVQVGLYNLLEEKPRLVVSGINAGENIGHGRILSSGTIGASMEASISNVKSISTSLHIPPQIKARTDFSDPNNYKIFESAAKITMKLIKILIDEEFGPDVDLISINIPFSATVSSEFNITKPFRDSYGKLFHKTGEEYKHINPPIVLSNPMNGTDLKALSEGKISITPISLELCSKNSIEKLEQKIKDKW